jgi:hypothetical protein
MISDKYKCIFIHIERTGGTSIERVLFGIGPDDKPNWTSSAGPKHISAKAAKKQFGNKRWNDYFKFSIVRNPWDLVVSNYFFPWFHNGEHGKVVDFKTWLLRWRNEPAWRNSINSNKVPQLNAISIKNRIAMDYIIRFETLNEEWKEVAKKIGAKDIIPNNWSHRLLRNPWLKDRRAYPYYYDKETKAIVARRFKKDINYFGYKFGENIITKKSYKG